MGDLLIIYIYIYVIITTYGNGRNLSIYPTGDQSKDGEGHISIYLEMVDTSSLPAGWEVNAIFNFFLFDQFRDEYVGPQGNLFQIFNLNVQSNLF